MQHPFELIRVEAYELLIADNYQRYTLTPDLEELFLHFSRFTHIEIQKRNLFPF